MRGGEKVVEALCRLFPQADIFTLFYDPERVCPEIRSHRITASFLNPFRRFYRSLLPFMPMALESLDLRDYDLIISSESGPAKGIIASSAARHICYCHTPMRYLWDLYPAYLRDWTRPGLKRAIMPLILNYLRLWDVISANRVDEFVANSGNVQTRIWKTYRRSSRIIYPPVDVETFYSAASEDYYLVVSELVAYKRIADAVRCCSETGRRLKVVGSGPEYRQLRKIAGTSVEFCGHTSDSELRGLYASCRAVLMPGEEDFGIVAVEALASGKPVIALGRGGVLESAREENPRAGFFYRQPGPESLHSAIDRFELLEHTLSPKAIQQLATPFSTRRFEHEMKTLLAGQEVTQDAFTPAIPALNGCTEHSQHGQFYQSLTVPPRQ